MKRALIVIAASSGCGDDDCCTQPDAGAPYVEIAAFPYVENPLVDILFVVDDSIGGVEMQAGIKSAFPAFLSELDAGANGRPSLHIGVVSTDLGTSSTNGAPAASIGTGPGSCSDAGKYGYLQTNGVDLMGDNFIEDTRNSDGSRTINYADTLANTFNALVSLGGSGCGFEQPLRAMQAAFAPGPSPGYLRGGNLAIVFVTDEDDCSVAHPTFFGPDDATLGPVSSFRCTRHGVQCDVGGATPDEMNQPGEKSGCHANETSSFVEGVKSFVDSIGYRVPQAYETLVTLIATRPEPVTVELRPPPGGGAAVPALASTCSYVGGGTNAAVRLDQFAASFPRNVRSDICTNDFTTPMIETARVIRQMTGDRCIGRPIPSGTECTVVAVRGALEEELQGWSLVADPTHCTAEGNLLLELTLPDPVPGDLLVSLRCRL